jgi:predicted transcriptional regulator YheO
MNPILTKYIPFVDFLAEALGHNTEVVLHDVSDFNNSVVAIRNNHISGRQVGSPMTNLGLKVIKEAGETHQSFIAGYQSRSKDGNLLKSSTYFIKDENDQIIAMLCLNTDYHMLQKAKDALAEISEELAVPDLQMPGMVSEFLSMDVSELIEHNIRRAYPEYGTTQRKLSQKEKMEIVSRLNDMGTFLMKGAVAYVAEAIGSSVPTIYRYLNSMKDKKGDK